MHKESHKETHKELHKKTSKNVNRVPKAMPKVRWVTHDVVAPPSRWLSMVEHWVLSWRVTQRHWLLYKKDFLANISPTVIDPALFLLAFGVGMGAYVRDMNGISYLHFIGPGLCITTALFTAFFESSYNFFVRLTYERIYDAMMSTPIGPLEIITGEFIWITLKGSMMSLGVGVVLTVFGVVDPTFLFVIPFVGGLVALACGALGLIATALVRNINQFQMVYALIISPMFFLSGAFYPTKDMPEIWRTISGISPLYHGVRMGQQVLWNEKIMATLLFHGPILIFMTAVLVAVAYRMIFPKLYQ